MRYYIPSWLVLKKLTDSKIARLAIIVPIVGWLLMYNDNLVLVLGQYLEIDISASISWKLYAFYIGLVLISISAIIFIIFCPDEIKKHDDNSSFVEFERRMYTKQSDRDTSKSNKIEPIVWNDPDIKRKVGVDFPLVRMYEANEEKIINQLKLIFHTKNYSWSLFRLVSFFIFIVGVCLTISPTVATVQWCIGQLLNILSI